jgi:hypothetical protein
MIYALLTSASVVTPTVTPAPPVFPDMWNFTGVNFIDILGLLFTFGLGIAAYMVSRSANKFAKQQQMREEEMRQREAKIAVMEQMFIIYNFFNCRISDEDYFTFSDENIIMKRLDEIDRIDNISRLIFDKETFDKIYLETGRIGLCFSFRYLPFVKDVNKEYKTDADISSDFATSEPPEQMASLPQRRKELIKVIRKNINAAFEKYKLNL